jgi:hypothetical protein
MRVASQTLDLKSKRARIASRCAGNAKVCDTSSRIGFEAVKEVFPLITEMRK